MLRIPGNCNILDEKIAELETWIPYFNAENALRRNLARFKCKIPPIVLDLTFYNLWPWDVPAKINAILPELRKVVLLKRSNAWNCVWISKISSPQCERQYCELIFFGNKELEPESPRFRSVMLDLMHRHEELTGYNIVGMAGDCSLRDWVLGFSQCNGPFTIEDCGEWQSSR